MPSLLLLGILGFLPVLVLQGGPAPLAAPVPRDLYVSPSGSDHASGMQPEAPLRSLDLAVARAGAGTTVHLLPGTYREALITRRGGTRQAPLVFKGHRGAVIDGSELPHEPGKNQNQGLVELRHPHVRLEGLTITRSPNTGILLAADDLVITGCEVSYAQRHGISSHTGYQRAEGKAMPRGISLEGNAVHHCVLKGAGFGQAVSLIAEDFRITHNRVYQNGAEGIDVWLGASRGEVCQNEVYSNRAPGIYVDGASYVRIHRNRVHSNAKGGIGVSSEDPRYRTHDVWVYNNLVYDHADGDGAFVWDPDVGSERVLFAHNTLVGNKVSFSLAGRGNSVEVANNLGMSLSGSDTANWSVGSTIRLHGNVWVETLGGFRDPGRKDFRLKPVSPGVDAGKRLAPRQDDRGNVLELDIDFASQPRPQGKAPDAGAFETP